MSDAHAPETGTIAALVGVVSLVLSGLMLLFRAAFKVGSESRATDRIATDLAEIKVELRNLATKKAEEHQQIFTDLADLKARLRSLENDARRSRPDIGE